MKTGIKEIKTFCKERRLKYEKLTKDGFVCSLLSNIRAGMEYRNGRIIDYKIKTIGKKRVYYNMVVWNDGDITWSNKIYNYNEK